ncbi:HNH endonuclease [Candidatus Saccharibacteria bacterium]|nr:HNH endonuclease [Candidatus Saccharibacteria bacterium]
MNHKARRILSVVAILAGVVFWLVTNPESYETDYAPVEDTEASSGGFSDDVFASSGDIDPSAPLATAVLEKLEIKGRAPKTGYVRSEFYSSWPTIDGCSLRQRIIKREMGDTAVISTENNCDVISGEFDDPYTGEHKVFSQKSDFSSGIQIDHVVALSDAWQKGAQYKTADERYALATDPLNLLAVDSSANQKKSDGDAATWLPSNKKFRCQYVARQVSVKYKYGLWVSQAEHDMIQQVLEKCPNERAVGVEI